MQQGQTHVDGMFHQRGQVLTAVATLLAAGWILLVGSLELHELIVGLAVVALCTAFCALVLRSSTLSLRLQWSDICQVRRIPAEIAKDTVVVLRVLFADVVRGRPAGSFYRVCGFQSSLHDPVLIARSALAVTYSTISPNMIVLGIDPTQSHMLFHQLQRDEVAATSRALGAGE